MGLKRKNTVLYFLRSSFLFFSIFFFSLLFFIFIFRHRRRHPSSTSKRRGEMRAPPRIKFGGSKMIACHGFLTGVKRHGASWRKVDQIACFVKWDEATT